MPTRIYDSEDSEFIDFDTLADWEDRDKAKDRRIEALEAALAKADCLANACRDLGGANTLCIVEARVAYRTAREATK